jgi:hypothetical protein
LKESIRWIAILQAVEHDLLERWGLRLPATAVDFAQLTREIAQLDSQIAGLERALEERREALDALKADRNALRDFRNFYVHFSGENSGNEATHPPPRPGTKRALILDLLADGRPWPVEEIQAAFDERKHPGTYSSLLSTLSHMYTAGEIGRERPGVYRLSPDDSEQEIPAPTVREATQDE